jgi:hypothetical protein
VLNLARRAACYSGCYSPATSLLLPCYFCVLCPPSPQCSKHTALALVVPAGAYCILALRPVALKHHLAARARASSVQIFLTAICDKFLSFVVAVQASVLLLVIAAMAETGGSAPHSHYCRMPLITWIVARSLVLVLRSGNVAATDLQISRPEWPCRAATKCASKQDQI